MEAPRIVFYGTPEFAVFSLKALAESGHRIVAVVTSPDKPAGRGLKARSSAVKVFAVAAGIPVLQPLNLKDPEFLEELRSFRPELQIVIAFRMLPRDVWALPPLGTFNLHASLLPQYRGAAPIHWAIINGETETGVTTFLLDDQIDTGKIILSRKIGIGSDETTGELHDRLMIIGAEVVLETTKMIMHGFSGLTDQTTLISDPVELKKAPRIFRDDCRIRWDQESEKVRNMIRGLTPYPGAFTLFTDPAGRTHNLKIISASVEYARHSFAPGHFFRRGSSGLLVTVPDGFILIRQMQLEGKKVMQVADFLRGYNHLFSELPDL